MAKSNTLHSLILAAICLASGLPAMAQMTNGDYQLQQYNSGSGGRWYSKYVHTASYGAPFPYIPITQTLTIAGDVTGTGTLSSGTISVALPSSGVTSGTYGSGTSTGVFVVNIKGQVTGATNTPITFSAVSATANSLGSGAQAQVLSISSTNAALIPVNMASPYQFMAEMASSQGNQIAQYYSAPWFSETWSGLGAWTTTNVQVSGGFVYSSSNTNPAGLQHAISLPSNQNFRLQCVFKVVSSTVGETFVGVSNNTAGAGIDSGHIFVIGYAGDTGNALYYYDGTTGQQGLAAPLVSGTYAIQVSCDASYVSFFVTSATYGAFGYKRIPRSAIGSINNIAIWQKDDRGLSGCGVGQLTYKQGSGSVFSGTGVEFNYPFYATTAVNSDPLWIILPPGYDSRVPTPLIMWFHGADENETSFNYTSTEFTDVLALLKAGYIVCSAAGTGSGWGNNASVQAYAAAYHYIAQTYNVSGVGAVGQSMGGLNSLNLIARAGIPCAAWYGIFPVCNLAGLYASGTGTYAGEIQSAYSFGGTSGYAAATAGHDPLTFNPMVFASVPIRMTSSYSDTAVPRAQNADAFQALVSPFVPTCTILTTTGTHGDASNFVGSDIVGFFNTYLRVTGTTYSNGPAQLR